MNSYCIYDFLLPPDSINRSESWLIEIPCSVVKILNADSKSITCLKDLNENKETLVKICLIQSFDDFNTIDKDLNEHYDDFQYMGKEVVGGKNFHIYTKIIGKKNLTENDF